MSALLAACVPPANGPGAALAPAPSAPLSAEVAVPHAKTTLALGPLAPALLVPASLPAAGARPNAAPTVLALDRLKGLSARELAAALGDPTLLSRDGPAQIWQYAGQGCVLQVFLYQERDSFRVRYAELRIDDAAATLAPACTEWKGKPLARPIAAPAADGLSPGAAPTFLPPPSDRAPTKLVRIGGNPPIFSVSVRVRPSMYGLSAAFVRAGAGALPAQTVVFAL